MPRAKSPSSLPDLPRTIEEVFMNLTSNAVEAMESRDKRQLSIETDCDKERRKIWIRVKDTGIGIIEANVPKLFEPFFTTKKQGKGVGLGLAVVYGIIQNHGGTITVHSTPDEGSEFKIEFPY